MRNCTRWLLSLGLLFVVTLPSVSHAQTGDWQPGPDAIGDSTYDGFIDIPSNGSAVPGSGTFTVAGWFVDTTAEGWAGADDVQVFLGQMGSGGTMLAKAQIAQNRPDVGAATGNPFWSASGYSAVVNGSSVPGGSQTLSVYAHTPGKGWWFKQVSVDGGGPATGGAPAPSQPVAGAPPQLTITAPAPESNVCTRSDYTIAGTATDPGFGPSGIDRIDVFINGERDSRYSTQLGTTTPGSDGTWTLTFRPTKFPSMHSNLFVYAHSKNTGQETLVSRGFNITDHC